jgi:hypothetical protein
VSQFIVTKLIHSSSPDAKDMLRITKD